jgi:hypothetical protein
MNDPINDLINDIKIENIKISLNYIIIRTITNNFLIHLKNTSYLISLQNGNIIFYLDIEKTIITYDKKHLDIYLFTEEKEYNNLKQELNIIERR